MNLLKCNNITKKIGNKIILNNINLKIDSGDVIGLIGPNGAGKTTLMKCLLNIEKIDNGNININGFDKKNDFEASISRVGAIIEEPVFYNYMSGMNNLKQKARIYNLSNKQLLHIVSLVELTNKINYKVSTYSLGMKQRLAIAYSLINNPNILILDEPINGLDPNGIIFLKRIIKELSNKGIAVLISSHILSEIESICNKIIIIKNGEIIENTTINKNKNNSYIFELSSTKDVNLLFKNKILSDTLIKVFCNKEFIPLVIESLVKSKINIYSVKEEYTSLEQIFINKIGDAYD